MADRLKERVALQLLRGVMYAPLTPDNRCRVV